MEDAAFEEQFKTVFAQFGSEPPWKKRREEAIRRQWKLRYLEAADLEIHRAAGNVIHNGASYCLLSTRPPDAPGTGGPAPFGEATIAQGIELALLGPKSSRGHVPLED